MLEQELDTTERLWSMPIIIKQILHMTILIMGMLKKVNYLIEFEKLEAKDES